MARITKHGGVSDRTLDGGPPVKPTDDDVESSQPVDRPVDDAGVDGAPEPVEDDHGDVSVSSDEPVEHEPPAEEPDDRSADGNPVSPPAEEEPAPSLELPPTNALKSVWEEALAGAGVSREWLAADGRTKDEMQTAGRGIADGSLRIEDGVPVETDG